METNTVLKLVGGAAVVSTLYAFKKKNDYSKVIEQMTMDIRNIRKIRMSSGRLYLDIDIRFRNPTDYDMTIFTAGMIKLRQIKLMYKGVVIGNAFSSKTEFQLPAKSSFDVTDIQVELLFLNIIDQFMKGGLDSNLDNYQIHTTIESLGKTWIVEQ